MSRKQPSKNDTTNSQRKPGRPLSSERKTESFYVRTKLLDMNRQHAFETGTTKSAIVEKLLSDYFGLSDGEMII